MGKELKIYILENGSPIREISEEILLLLLRKSEYVVFSHGYLNFQFTKNKREVSELIGEQFCKRLEINMHYSERGEAL
jgi:hypothetical protein